MRCDLHVHTVHSGMCTVPVARRFCRESFAEPLEVRARLKQLGMDLVTITDHDSIDAAEELGRFDDFFLSEEATCIMPSGTEVHVGIYDITERQHLQVQRRRDDFFSLIAYLGEQRLFFTVNHAFSRLTGRRDASDFAWFASEFPGMEILNGALSPVVNDACRAAAGMLGKAAIGGSDAHCLRSAGTAWTTVPGARSRREFLDGLRHGHAIVAGETGTWWKLTRDVLSICGCMVQERPWTALLAPLIAMVPAATAIIWARDAAFARQWLAYLESSEGLADLPGPAGERRAA